MNYVFVDVLSTSLIISEESCDKFVVHFTLISSYKRSLQKLAMDPYSQRNDEWKPEEYIYTDFFLFLTSEEFKVERTWEEKLQKSFSSFPSHPVLQLALWSVTSVAYENHIWLTALNFADCFIACSMPHNYIWAAAVLQVLLLKQPCPLILYFS